MLGMDSGAAVSAQAKRCEPWLDADPKLRKLVEKIKRCLDFHLPPEPMLPHSAVREYRAGLFQCFA